MNEFLQTLNNDYINGIMLTGLIIINIFLGSLDGIIDKKWDTTKFLKGLYKGGGIAIATYLTYLLGGLNPTIFVMTANDVAINIQTAISLTITAGIVWYGKDIITKIKKFIKGN